MSKPKVFVVQPIMEIGATALAEFADVEVHESDRMIRRAELLMGARDADFILMLGDTPIDAGVIEESTRLRGIATMALFPNVVDVDAATGRGIPVTVVPHVITKATCDLTMALILGLAWRINEADRFTRSGRFRQEQSTAFLTTGVTGKTLGMIGLGEIGTEIMKRAGAFEMELIYTKRRRLDSLRESELGVDWVDERDEVIRRSDFLVVMATYNPTTHRMIGEREFEMMKSTAYFINTARGRIVDEPALIAALRSGQIAGAGLDVYWNEPPISEPSPSPELLELENVILTPHIGSATVEARNQMIMAVVRNLRAMVDGERPPDLFNTELYGEPRRINTDRTG